MQRINLAAAAAITAAVVLGMRGTVATQGNALAAGRVTHIGIVARDIDATLREYRRVMGFASPPVTTHSQPVPGGTNAEFKLATLGLPNFHIGTTMKVILESSATPSNALPPPAAPTDGSLPPLGALKVAHLGFAASDTAAAVGTLTSGPTESRAATTRIWISWTRLA